MTAAGCKSLVPEVVCGEHAARRGGTGGRSAVPPESILPHQAEVRTTNHPRPSTSSRRHPRTRSLPADRTEPPRAERCRCRAPGDGDPVAAPGSISPEAHRCHCGTSSGVKAMEPGQSVAARENPHRPAVRDSGSSGCSGPRQWGGQRAANSSRALCGRPPALLALLGPVKMGGRGAPVCRPAPGARPSAGLCC